MNSWHSYPSIYALGHKAVAEILLDPVLVEEKVDGSQFSFGWFPELEESHPDGLLCRSKGAQIQTLAPDKMFARAVEVVKSLRVQLQPGWTYRAEYLAKPKHNVMAYDRIPSQHLILFDINPAEEEYLDYETKVREATRLGLEVVPKMHYGTLADLEFFRLLLEKTSVLGGQKVEGVVVKNYARYGRDKKVLMGKFVSEAFKEVHAAEWKIGNRAQGDVIQLLVSKYRTPARWQKALQHLKEAGQIEGSPRDIGLLIREVAPDIEEECTEEIKEKLYEWAWPKLRRALTAGLPEWYKEELLKGQFEHTEPTPDA